MNPQKEFPPCLMWHPNPIGPFSCYCWRCPSITPTLCVSSLHSYIHVALVASIWLVALNAVPPHLSLGSGDILTCCVLRPMRLTSMDLHMCRPSTACIHASNWYRRTVYPTCFSQLRSPTLFQLNIFAYVVVHQSNALPAQYIGVGSLCMLHLYSVYVMRAVHMDWAFIFFVCNACSTYGPGIYILCM